MTATISDSSSRAQGRGKPSARSAGERTTLPSPLYVLYQAEWHFSAAS